MKKLLVLLALVALAPLPAYADIVIGLAGPSTGENAFFGEQMKHGAGLAVQDINAAGGINGEKLTLHFADDACDPKQAVAVANQMASLGVKFVVGHACSGASIPAAKVYDEEGILMITPISTNPALTDAGYTTIFRDCGRDDQQGTVLANYILKHFPGKNVAITHDQSAWGFGIASQMKKTLNAAGTKETLFEAFSPGERDYSAFISRMKEAKIDVAFLGGYPTSAGLIVRQMKAQGAHFIAMGGDAIATTQFWDITKQDGTGVLMSYGPDQSKLPEAQSVVASMKTAGFEPEGYTLNSYAAVQAIAEGIKRAKASDPTAVAAKLRETPVHTVLGDLTFDAKGDISGTNFVVYKWHDGKYTEADQ